MEEEINVVEILMVMVRRWYVILISIAILLAVFWLPQLSKKDAYEARAALLLKDGGSQTLNQLGALSSLLGGGSSGGGPMFTVLLSSRAVAELVMDELNLRKRITGWDAPDIKRQDLITTVRNMAECKEKDGLFEIRVVTDSPTLSADVANAFASAGAEYWRKLNYSEARKKREYVEGQLPRVEADLRRAEYALKRFTIIAPGDASLQGVEMKRLEREYAIQETTYLMLRKEYESAKLEESKELDPFSMIDPAEPPFKPLKPKILLNFVIALIMGAFLGVGLSFGLEAIVKQSKRS